MYKKFIATTIGLEHAVFNYVITKNVAEFMDFRDNIANDVAVDFKYSGSEAEKALEEV